MMKRKNPETGTPFKSGDARADGMVFRSYQLTRKLPSDPQYFYENWYNPEAFKAKKDSTNEQVKKFNETQRNRAISVQGRKRVNAKTGEIFKFGDLSLDGKKVFSSYVPSQVTEDGCIKEVWYTLAGFERYQKNLLKWKEENTFRLTYYAAKRRAKKNSLQFKITKDYLEEIFPSDNLCPVFGVEFERGGQGRERDNSPSLDRIIPELGYVEGNVVWISNRANTLKRDATWEELQKVASWLKSMTPK
jgi:hypothetical protein